MMFQYNRRTAFFAALCLFFTFIEFSLPKPSFLKLGLANIPLLLALSAGFSPIQFLQLAFMKVLLNLVVGGTLFSYIALLSLSSTLCSALLMLLTFTLLKKWTTPLSWSIIGSVGANTAQLFIASFYLGKQVFQLARIVYSFGLASSVFTGIIALLITESSVFEKLKAGPQETKKTKEQKKVSLKQAVLITLTVLLIIVNFFIKLPLINLGFLLLSIILFLAEGKKLKAGPPLALIFTVLFITLLQKDGAVIFSIASAQITKGALMEGLHKGFTLLSSFYFSSFIMSKYKGDFSSGLINQTMYYWGKINSNFSSDKKIKLKEKILQALEKSLDADELI